MPTLYFLAGIGAAFAVEIVLMVIVARACAPIVAGKR